MSDEKEYRKISKQNMFIFIKNLMEPTEFIFMPQNGDTMWTAQ